MVRFIYSQKPIIKPTTTIQRTFVYCLASSSVSQGQISKGRLLYILDTDVHEKIVPAFTDTGTGVPAAEIVCFIWILHLDE